ncbi:nicotinate (nicotinamide) nucleotide adenylyltransferase [Pollutimonas harenae]|uniref:Probable nicotinate-nucleotide adenylyltransferase n=1 Tax=Pollutimonas harenae TaxID=657015 RepID=A0A853GZX0_9BURK|nr:nicotinate (nicotinamide) nucleotide adenylyltransferase [Pollutimonas harenae]NYT85642.1 nicotinate (nicotinamide) nucleotide adenylyltransferase [Pollutimonas harenae]TEA70719.1 nicotinate (nicotinamide) nucleotide adenylyltransferase [Pollutimonas harenae]
MAVKIGLLGGSFDPIHLAHVGLAVTAWQALGLDHVQLIPAANPWQREPLAASASQRLAMLDIAIRKYSHLRINTIEIDRGGPSYTITTLRQLPAGPEYYWILGADQLENFCTWESWEDISRLAHLAVAQRPGAILQAPAALTTHLHVLGRSLIPLPFEPTPISATEIRQRLAAGESTTGMLDVAVEQYIQQKGLYQAPSA